MPTTLSMRIIARGTKLEATEARASAGAEGGEEVEEAQPGEGAHRGARALELGMEFHNPLNIIGRNANVREQTIALTRKRV